VERHHIKQVGRLSMKAIRRTRQPTIDPRPVLYFVGLLLMVLGIAMIPPGLLSIVLMSRDDYAFMLSAAVTIGIAGLLIMGNRAEFGLLTRRQVFLLTVAAWWGTAAFGALPFCFSQLRLSYTDAFFETMSGLTTTGSTVLVGLDSMPPTLLLWRAILQWLGGIGIVVMAIAVLPMLRSAGMELFHSESSDRSEKPMARLTQLSSWLCGVYVGMSVLCALAFWLAGMTPFDAITHSMTTVSTGGYANYDASFGYFKQAAVHWVGIIFMIAGALPFVLYVRAVRGDWGLLHDRQVQVMLAILFLSVLALCVWLSIKSDMSLYQELLPVLFNVTSIMTTTGFASTDYTLWGSFAVGVFFYLTFIGGCAGSTAGAIKIFRFQIMMAALGDLLVRRFYPHAVGFRSYGGRDLPDDVLESVMAFIFVYAAAVGLIALGLAAVDLDWVTSLSGAATALGNVGPGLGPIIGPAGNFSSLPDSAKWMLSIGMLLGRLELFTLLVLFVPRFWRN
jgi:trk system potassium uptake protein TrkH